MSNRTFISAAEWIRQLADETAAFKVAKVVEEDTKSGSRGQMIWDQVVTLSVKPDQRRLDLFVETRQQVSPSTMLRVFDNLKCLPPDGVFLICTTYVSPRVADLCREHNVGYLDAVGNCRIVAPGLFVHVSGRPNRATAEKAAIDPFSRKSSRIVRTLLSHSDRHWQVQQLAQQADVSLGLASKVKTALLEEAYLEERDRLLVLRDPVKLLQDWANRYRPHVKPLQLFTFSRPFDAERRLAEWCRSNQIGYAFTQLSAAWRYSPMVRHDKSVVYIDHKLESGNNLKALLGHMDARAVDTGANCTVWLTDDPAIFTDAREFEGVKVVSPIQLYLDLTAMAGRGEDAAQEILEQELQGLFAASRRDSEPKPGGDQ